jgi:glycine oxidase
LNSPTNQSVLIIGAGVVGYTTALTLAQQGHAVTVLDCGQGGRESSWAGAGILSPLLPWQYGDAVNRLCRLGAARYQSLAEQLLQDTGRDAELVRCGMTLLPPFDVGAATDWCGRHAVRAEWGRDGTLHLAEVAQVRNPRLLQALRLRLEQMGVALLENRGVTGFALDSGRVAAAETPGGNLAADQVVVCAGAWARVLLGDLGAGLDIRPIRGQMLLFKGPPGVLNTILYRDGLYLVPRRDGHVLVGSTLEDVGFDKTTTREAHEQLYRQALALFPPIADMVFLKQWAGLRPGTPDNLPVIARHPRIENLWINAGHFRYGVTMAPASAEILAALMAGDKPPIPAGPYAWPPSR